MDARAAEHAHSREREEERLMLCHRLAREGIPVASYRGECPIHGGTYCLQPWIPEQADD